MKKVSRRRFVVQTSGGAAALVASLGNSPAGLAAAHGNRPQRLRVFSESQAKTYAAWCEILAIGASEAGVAKFVDKYLAEPYPESLLLLRYLQNPPFTSFHVTGIAGIDQESQGRFSKPFLALGTNERKTVVDAAATSSTIAWTNPNPNFFYFISRSDAVDVVYGTVAGFRDLDIPYLPHISPSRPW
jgi:hypothetical protein